jgi:predicted nucleic acid-binding protein
MRTGTIYAAAKRSGLIDSVGGRLDALRAAGFWLRERDYQAILKACGES